MTATKKIAERGIWFLLQSLAGSNIFALQAPANAPGPFIIYQRIDSNDRWRALDGPSGIAQAIIKVDGYAATYNAAKDLGSQIETILDGYSGTVQYGEGENDFVEIGNISLQSDEDSFDETETPFLYRSTATYLVTYTQ